MSTSQKEAVFVAIQALFEDKSETLPDQDPVTLNKDERKTVINMVATAALSGNMALSAEATAKYDTIEKMRGYVNGLLSNWLRKDTRLNGGDKYIAKNPGSRAGQGDEVLKNLKALKSTLTDADHVEAVDAEIAKRTTEIQASKAKKVAIDFSKLPESLRSMFDK